VFERIYKTEIATPGLRSTGRGHHLQRRGPIATAVAASSKVLLIPNGVWKDGDRSVLAQDGEEVVVDPSNRR
jgi:hypothetical protein